MGGKPIGGKGSWQKGKKGVGGKRSGRDRIEMRKSWIKALGGK